MKEHYSTEGAVCPYCGDQIDPSDDNYELYSESTSEWECGECGKEFRVSIYVSHSWTTSAPDTGG